MKTIAINPQIEKKISDIARLTETDAATVLENLLADSVAAKLGNLAAIQEGLDDLEAGRVVSHEEAINKAKATIAQRRAARS